MQVVGVAKKGGYFQWALLRFDTKIVVERIGSGSVIPEEIVSIKDLIVVTGLDGSSVLRRDLKLPITSPKTILEALPFQLESVLPYPVDQTVVYPELHITEKESFVVAWATTKELIQNHLTKQNFIEPDYISCETLALARWARFFFPHEAHLTLLHDTVGVALSDNKIVCAMEASDPDRLKLFLKQKYPLYTWIDQGPTEEAWNFAIPIGLALEPFQKKPCQFRPPEATFSRQKKRRGVLVKQALALGLGLNLITAAVASAIFYARESKLKEQISVHHSIATGSLENRLQSFRDSILKASKSKPSVFNAPSTQNVLAWLSMLQAPVEITHFSYELQSGSTAVVFLEFLAPAPSEADLFVKQLQQRPTFVEPTQDLKWTSTPQGYKLSFALRKSS